jgi:hypothetical protein
MRKRKVFEKLCGSRLKLLELFASFGVPIAIGFTLGQTMA